MIEQLMVWLFGPSVSIAILVLSSVLTFGYAVARIVLWTIAKEAADSDARYRANR